MKRTATIYILLIASCFSLFLYGLFYVNAYSNISDNFKISENKYDFLASSGALIDFLKDAEGSQRGYIITGDDKYIESYENALYRFKQERNRFNQLTKRYDIYKENEADFSRIDHLVNQKITEMDQTILLSKSNNSEAAIAIVKSDAGMKVMKEISVIFQKLSFNQKFKEVKAKQDISADRVQFKIYTVFTGVFTFICLVIIGILFFLNQRANSSYVKRTKDSFIFGSDEELKAPKEDLEDTNDYIPSI